MATAPTPGRATARNADEAAITIKVDGEPFTLYPNLITARDSSAIRKQTGASVRKLVEMAQDDADIDVIAALVWIARCQAGEDVSFDDVAAAITYETSFGEPEVTEQPLPVDHPLP